MSIVSTSFLFLFLPLSVLIYHLIPAGKNLYYRNLFLIAVSLFFYAWGEPLYVFLLLFLMLFVHIAGKMIDKKRGTAAAKVIIAVTAVLGIGVILFFRDINSWLSVLGRLIRHSFAPRPEGVPLGMAFSFSLPFRMLWISTVENVILRKAFCIPPCIFRRFSK